MRKSIALIITFVLALVCLIPQAIAYELEYPPITSPYTEYGAETYSALNLFKAIYPDTTPGEEEWCLNINWGADPKRGYLSLPLPGHGKNKI